MSRIVGNEGSASMGTHTIVANAWSMSVSRVVSDVTGFADLSSSFVGGLPTYTGSMSGFMETTSSPELDVAQFATGTVAAITLTASASRTYSGSAVISGVSISSSKTGEATISFDFSFTGAVTEVWTG